jgi:hypothetical protein
MPGMVGRMSAKVNRRAVPSFKVRRSRGNVDMAAPNVGQIVRLRTDPARGLIVGLVFLPLELALVRWQNRAPTFEVLKDIVAVRRAAFWGTTRPASRRCAPRGAGHGRRIERLT